MLHLSFLIPLLFLFFLFLHFYLVFPSLPLLSLQLAFCLQHKLLILEKKEKRIEFKLQEPDSPSLILSHSSSLTVMIYDIHEVKVSCNTARIGLLS